VPSAGGGDDPGAAAAAPAAERPGFYRLRVEGARQARAYSYAANVPAIESDLRATPAEAFLAAMGAPDGAGAAKAAVAGTGAERAPSDRWAVCLALAALALVAESLLANRILLDTKAAASVQEVEPARASGD
jgi:hypothetical protein